MPTTLGLALNPKNLENELKEVVNWHGLGVQLGIASRILDEIESDYQGTARRRSALLRYWLENCSNKSWQVLAKAVANIDLKNLSRKLQNYVDVPEAEDTAIADGRRSHIHEQQPHSIATSRVSQGVTSDTRLSSGDVSYLVEILHDVAFKWREIGLALRFSPTELDNILGKHNLMSNAPYSYLQELLSQWVQWPNDAHPDGIATVGGLESALRSRMVGYGAVAESLKKNFQKLRNQTERDGRRLQSLAAAQNTNADERAHSSSYRRQNLHSSDPQPRQRIVGRDNLTQMGAPSDENTRPNVNCENRDRTNTKWSLCFKIMMIVLLVVLVIFAAGMAARNDFDFFFNLKGSADLPLGSDDNLKPEPSREVDIKIIAPTIIQLTHLKLPAKEHNSDDDSINILLEIGGNYLKFGTLLLNDETGHIVDAIVSKNMGKHEAINRDIVTKWLDGEGKHPITWETLIEVLDDIRLRTLAQKIREAIDL